MLEVLDGQKFIGDRAINRTRFCQRGYNDFEFNTRTNEIHIRLQPAPRKIVGDQGVDPKHLIILCRDIFVGLNKRISCKENEMTIELLNQCIELQNQRDKDRIARKVEGTIEP